jgi:hypothetical protein
MGDGSTDVSVLSLEDFKATLQQRLDDANDLLRQLNGLGAGRLKLGTFQDAHQSAGSYDWKLDQYVDRVRRLRDAILAAQIATAEIITAYRTTEARNQADAADIAAHLGTVTNLLGAVVGAAVGGVIGTVVAGLEGLTHGE